MWERCRFVPPRKYPSRMSTRPSVSKFAIARLALRVRLGGGEAEEELRRVGDQVGARDACGGRHRLRQARRRRRSRRPGSPCGCSSARRASPASSKIASRAVGDVLAIVAADAGSRRRSSSRIVAAGIAREADRVEQRRHRALRRSPKRGGRSGCAAPRAQGRSGGSTAAPQATVTARPAGVTLVAALEAARAPAPASSARLAQLRAAARRRAASPSRPGGGAAARSPRRPRARSSSSRPAGAARPAAPGWRALGRLGELVDQLVDAGGSESAGGGAAEQLLACQPHRGCSRGRPDQLEPSDEPIQIARSPCGT